jgi:hypothetical protein
VSRVCSTAAALPVAPTLTIAIPRAVHAPMAIMIAYIHALRLGRKLDLLLQDFLCGCDHVETSVNVKALTQECVIQKKRAAGAAEETPIAEKPAAGAIRRLQDQDDPVAAESRAGD